MRRINATEAARKFSELLDAIESGERVTITRGQAAVAEIGPVRQRTGADLNAALEGITPPDDTFKSDINEALAFVSNERARASPERHMTL